MKWGWDDFFAVLGYVLCIAFIGCSLGMLQRRTPAGIQGKETEKKGNREKQRGEIWLTSLSQLADVHFGGVGLHAARVEQINPEMLVT